MVQEKKEWIAYVKAHKKTIMYGVLIVVLLGGGMGLGYYVWGIERGAKPDYKKYLNKTVGYIAEMEQKNKKMATEINALRTEVNLTKKKATEGERALQAQAKNLDEKITALEKENADLKTSLTEYQKTIEENAVLRARIDKLTGELSQLKEITAGPSPVEEKGENAPEEEASGIEAEESAPAVEGEHTSPDAASKE